MSYKDKEKNRTYQREWARRKREGLPTQIYKRVILSPEERKIKARENSYKSNKIIRAKRKELKEKYLGNCCKICAGKKRLIAHRKDGSSHIPFKLFKFKDFVLELQSGNYVLVCYNCHKSVHWCMKYLTFSWDNIYNRRLNSTLNLPQ